MKKFIDIFLCIIIYLKENYKFYLQQCWIIKISILLYNDEFQYIIIGLVYSSFLNNKYDVRLQICLGM